LEESIFARLADSAGTQSVPGPQRGNGVTAPIRVLFIPRRDIAIGKRLSVQHRVTPTRVEGTREACEPFHRESAPATAEIHDLGGQKATAIGAQRLTLEVMASSAVGS